jgi:hypothetical protein
LAPVVLCAVVLGMVPAHASDRSASAQVRWQCATPFLPEFNDDSSDGGDAGEGVSYLYVGDSRMHANFAADALFTAPLERKCGWYDSGLRLGPYLENNAFVQIEISRWKRFSYRQHVAVAWAVPHSIVEYRDTGMMLADGPHRLGIDVHHGVLRLLADGHVVCSTRSSSFVSPSQRTYFQVRAETNVLGSNGGARVASLRLKRDTDAVPRAFATDCILHRHGIAWAPMGRGIFAMRGAFYPNEATFFTGLDPDAACRS